MEIEEFRTHLRRLGTLHFALVSQGTGLTHAHFLPSFHLGRTSATHTHKNGKIIKNKINKNKEKTVKQTKNESSVTS